MSITVERRYRVTTNGTESDQGEDEARALAFGLLSALGIAPATAEPIETVAASVEPPAQLPSGPVQETARAATFTDERGLKMGSWGSDLPELRRLMADGVPLKEIARRLNRPLPATSSQFYKIKRAAEAMHVVAAPERETEPPPLPTVTPGEAAAVQGAVGWTPDGGWTREQTKALIRAMAPGHGGIREASEATGHSMGGCGLRWKHLKSAGLMTVEKYMSSPEAVPA
jgi:hypothetical protein